MKRFSIATLLVATLASAVLAQSDTAAWIAWTRANHFPIASIVSTPQDDFADLRFFKDVIGERRLVQLGESGHGVGQFDSAKVRLIKFFHEQMGFDVIAFESSIFECFAANANATSGVDMLQRSIFTVWATEEVLPLLLAGFDTQISSLRGVAGRPAFLRRVIAAIDGGYADEVASFDTTFVNALRGTRSDPAKWDESEAFYDRLDQFFREHHDELVEAFPGDPTPLVAERAAYSMVRYIRQLRTEAARPTDVGPEGAGAIRDAGMAENVTVLARDVYPERKILIWAHNFHTRYANASTTSIQPTMGAVVAERFRPDVYTIGLYMNWGSAAYNNRTIYVINPAISGSMEWVLANTGPPALFVDFLHQRQEQGNGWMFQPMYTREWGTLPLMLVPREQYDGVLLIDRVTPPNYLRF